MRYTDVFIARTEEQDKFRQILGSYRKALFQRWFPTFSNFLPRKPLPSQPNILLLYGEGGMGKSRLARKLKEILETESNYRNQFNWIFIDWEQKRSPDLADHQQVHPETVFSFLYNEFRNNGWASYFNDYKKLVNQIYELEDRVNRKIESHPDNELNKKLSEIGAKTITWIIRKHAGLDVTSEDSLERVLDNTLQISAELLSQGRRFLQSVLEPQEIDIYSHPHEKISIKFGQSLSALAQRKPLIVMMDTYEIVDREECDYTLRNAIKFAGDNVIWVIFGRSNLPKSRRLGDIDFRGYRQDFPEYKIYAKRLAEFGRIDIKNYFKKLFPENVPSDKDIDKLANYSLGVPLIIAEAAALWMQEADMQKIVEPITDSMDGKSLHENLIKTTTERFLTRCKGENEEAVYALALMRSRDPKLLQRILDHEDINTRLNKISSQFPFILAEEIRLNDKLAEFMHEYMLAPIRRNGELIQRLNDKAIQFLEWRLQELTFSIPDTADRYLKEEIVEVVLDLTHHYFWKSEQSGWKFAFLRFIEGWAYNDALVKGLLKVAERFKAIFSNEGQSKLRLISSVVKGLPIPVANDTLPPKISTSLDSAWSQLDGYAECKAILWSYTGSALRRNSLYSDALDAFKNSERELPNSANSLRRIIADEYYSLSVSITWSNEKNTRASYLPNAEISIDRAILLNPNKSCYHYCRGVILQCKGDYEEARISALKSIRIEPGYAKPYNLIGTLDQMSGIYHDAIRNYRKGIEVDNKLSSLYANLATVYIVLENYDEAIKVIKTFLEIESDNGNAWYKLGNLYRNKGDLEESFSAYEKAIDLAPQTARAYNGMGWLYILKKEPTHAIYCFEKAIEIDSREPSYYFNFGIVYASISNLEKARSYWREGVSLCTRKLSWEVLFKAFYECISNNQRDLYNDFQKAIHVSSDMRTLKIMLSDAEVLSEFPIQIQYLDRVTRVLKQRISTLKSNMRSS